MKTKKAVDVYETLLDQGAVHAYLTNSCYDTCAHCYMDAVSKDSCKSQFVDKDDLLHFVDLMGQGRDGKIDLALSGGDALLHPDIVELLDSLSSKSRLEVLTSGFALSFRNTENRKELLEALVRNKPILRVASPNESYHSFTWTDVSEVREYIKLQGFNPDKLGYPNQLKEFLGKLGLAATGIGLLGMVIGYLINKYGNPQDQVLPLGRGKKLPSAKQLVGSKDCTAEKRARTIFVSYSGQLQHCIYTVNAGFMNISELREVSTKKDAVELILERLESDSVFLDMIEHERCYFSLDE